jgi:hypothetical protein
MYVRSGFRRTVAIPDGGEVPVLIIKNNLRMAGPFRDDYFTLLDQV